jgi:voltage-gated potassium channel
MIDPSSPRASEHQGDSLRERLWRIIFLSDTPLAKGFDVVLLWTIAGSVLVVMLESVESIQQQHAALLYVLEWGFTLLFTLEYVLRLWVVRSKRRYVFSFFGIVDLLSIIPTYLEIFLTGSGHLIIIRILRLLRMFRVLKMAHHLGEANLLINALQASRSKVAVFIFSLLAIVSIEGTLMYLLESGQESSGFSSIPQSIYWGIVTVTTVGYGDIAPVTVAGKMLASIMMLTGFAIIAVPTGIVTAELQRERKRVRMDVRECEECGRMGHDPKARYCKMCGTPLTDQTARGTGRTL